MATVRRKPDKLNLTKDYIRGKVSDYDIFRNELGEFTIGVAICSPLRRDRNPSFAIYMSADGTLKFKDYARIEVGGDCFDLVAQKYNINYDKALHKIAFDFGILQYDGTPYEHKISRYQPIKDLSRHCFIQVRVRPYTDKDLEFWAQYGITKQQLVREQVYPLAEVFVNRLRIPLGKDEIAYCYKYTEGYKLYFPYREKGKKWKSNISTKLVENKQVLKTHNTIIIVKSKKDRLCLENIFPQLGFIGVQNESISPYTEEFIAELKDKHVYLSYDTDPPGKEASFKSTALLKCKHLNVPDVYYNEYGITDWADLYKKFGAEPIIEHFKNKKII